MRTAGDLGVPSNQAWPPAGWWRCVCVGTERWKSPKKGTPAIKLQWQSSNAEYAFEDALFLSVKAMRRVNLVALRVCRLDPATELPSDDAEALRWLAQFVMDNAQGKIADVNIETTAEQFMDEQTGQLRTAKRSRVAFAGYREPTARPDDLEPVDADGEKIDGDLPF